MIQTFGEMLAIGAVIIFAVLAICPIFFND